MIIQVFVCIYIKPKVSKLYKFAFIRIVLKANINNLLAILRN